MKRRDVLKFGLAASASVLAAPAANAPFYNATGTTLYVLGMLTSAFGLSVIV